MLIQLFRRIFQHRLPGIDSGFILTTSRIIDRSSSLSWRVLLSRLINWNTCGWGEIFCSFFVPFFVGYRTDILTIIRIIVQSKRHCQTLWTGPVILNSKNLWQKWMDFIWSHACLPILSTYQKSCCIWQMDLQPLTSLNLLVGRRRTWLVAY